MAYILSSLIAIATAIIIFLTKYDADDSSFLTKLELAEKSFKVINDSYTPLYNDFTTINFATLYANDNLPANITAIGNNANIISSSGVSYGSVEKDIKANILKAFQEENKTEIDKYTTTILILPNQKEIKYQLLPIVSGDRSRQGLDITASSGTGYKIIVDFSLDKTLLNKSAFTENRYKEICQNELFGDFFGNFSSINSDFNLVLNGSKSDGKIACIVYK
ncbi:hypothetical protein [Arcobacter porcinus]|uniref:hypothetical protein n=1 Tax=Arcobacter porcinus TaxID=1935204 RepID=UPI000824E617|nr:hypothetical protein [Arcobacter porcinus]OCL88265.1 hypothetical protein AAX30_00881 [Arcobacter porcinus]